VSDTPPDLLAHLDRTEARVRVLVAHRRADDPNPDDPFRGLYLPDEEIDRLLAPHPSRDHARPVGAPDLHDWGHLPAVRPGEHDHGESGGERLHDVHDHGESPPPGGDHARPVGDGRLARLAAACGLTALDVQLLVTALAPDVDARFERLYGYLNDDVTRRRASTRVALELAGVPPRSAPARARLAAGAPLVDRRLVLVEDTDRPFLSRGLRVPDRVTQHLLGDDVPDAGVLDLVGSPLPHDCPESAALARLLPGGPDEPDEPLLVYLRDHARRTGVGVAVAALRAAGRGTVSLDLTRLAPRANPHELVLVAGREALLAGAGLVAGPVEALDADTEALRLLAGLDVPVMLVGDVTWDPSWSDRVPLPVDAPLLDPAARTAAWDAHLAHDRLTDGSLNPPVHLRLGPEQIGRAVRSARLSSSLAAAPVDVGALQAGARAQNAAGLERLSRRLEPGVGWDDLVLTSAVEAQLRDLAARARHRDRVLTEWRMRPGGGRGHGVTALFAGDSGTGKTMSAEVIAGALGLDLYVVDLATVVDKYVGETEKNLERIFAEASGVNAVLLFDEADAVFGKRSEVRDAHDRYANIESAYLLQRMETFNGLAILATNLRANIDEAFTRRLDCIIDFPAPTEELRLSLWRASLKPPLPVADDVDFDFLANAFEFTGGNVRSAATSAAYLAAAGDRPVGMAEVIAAVEQEYRKLGRLVLEREFGRYLSMLR
jgi:hypothetical protein